MMLNRAKYYLGMHHSVPGEDDPQPDRGTVITRESGGWAARTGGDAPATTGSGTSDSFVGRVAGDDEAAAGPTGAEARSINQQRTRK